MAHQQIITLDPDESLLLTVRRSLFGLVPIILTGMLVLFGVLLAVYLIARFQAAVAETIPVAVALLVVLGVAFLVALMIAAYIAVYIGNEMLITNERIVKVTRRTVFSRHVSQMSLDQVQEVTVKQNNIFESLFGFGMLHIETAGEMDNFSFSYAKDPYHASKAIDEAVEAFKSVP